MSLEPREPQARPGGVPGPRAAVSRRKYVSVRPAASAVALLLLLAVLGGCASTRPATAATSSNAADVPNAANAAQPAPAPALSAPDRDPWEPFNRDVMAFNEALDKAIVTPVATAYRDAVPPLVRQGVNNFFLNFDDAWSSINHLLQAKFESSLQTGTRFLVNTFVGLGGLLDPASDMGLERQPEDFGQTLGVWGFGSGPYLVLPVFGPSSVRDAIALPLDRAASPEIYLLQGEAGRWALTGLNLVRARTNLLSASQLLDEIALDRYTFLRDAYLARRLNQVHDGNPPETDDADEAEPPVAPASEAKPAGDDSTHPSPAAPAPR